MRKVERRTRLLFGSLLIFSLLHMYNCEGANFLGVQQRFNDSRHFDFYYCCNICGGALRWSVDGAEVIRHLTSRTLAGNVEYVKSGINSSSLSYSSLILSKRPKDSQTCLDAVLVVTLDRMDYRPQVQCGSESNTVSYTIQYNFTQNKLVDNIDNTVTVRNPAYSIPDVVSPGNNYLSQVVVCRSKDKDNILRWSNGTFNAAYSGVSNAGSAQFQLHPLDNKTTLWNSIVLEKTEQFITCAIFWTDFISAGSYNISCHSHTDEVSTMVNTRPAEPNIIVLTVSSSESLLCYLPSIVVALVIVIWTTAT